MRQYLPLTIDILPATLHFKQPAATSRGTYRERHLWRIRITSTREPRLYGLGECAPLYDLSPDYTEDYARRLAAFCAEVARTGTIDPDALRPYPSMLFGLETAMLSARASLSCDYLRLFDTPFTRGEAGIPINGLVWMGSYDEMLRRMEDKLEQGFRCVKLKIGAIDFDRELDLIRTLRQRFSREVVELRVDANGAFSPDDALSRLEALARFGIHSIEQPIRAGQWEEMARLCRSTPLPIALDEELIGVNRRVDKAELLDTIRPQFIILKPTLHGGLSGAEEWIRMADERNIGRWVTSALESNLGLNAIAQWTASLATDTSTLMPQGLGTGALFTTNFSAAPLTVEGDRLWIAPKATRAFRAEVEAVRREWAGEAPTMTAYTSGSTGRPQPIYIYKECMAASARRTIEALGLRSGDTALLCMPVQYIAGRMMVVRAEVGGLRLICIPPSLHPLAGIDEVPTFAAMTPMQVFETLKVPAEAEVLRRVHCLIIGGGAVSAELEERLRDFPGMAWSTYGMTETLSHIALRRIGGNESEALYTPLPGVALSLTEEGCLVVRDSATCRHPLVTNDSVELYPDGRFRIIGRKDNVVCSGGLKFHIEELEQSLSALPFPVQLTAVPDPSLGEALTLLYVAPGMSREAVEAVCRQLLPRHAVPRHFLSLSALPMTATGKPARAEARRLACKTV